MKSAFLLLKPDEDGIVEDAKVEKFFEEFAQITTKTKVC